jgi:hypothetical protein
MSVKDVQKGFEKFGKLFKLMWISPGAMRWVSKSMPTKYFSSIDVFKAKAVKENTNYKKEKRRLRGARAKIVVVGALTLPVGLPLALIAMPFLFFYKGVPFLRTRHLNKVSKMLQEEFKFHKECARQCGKVLTAIGHPKIELVCQSCRDIIEGWGQEAGDMIQNNQVRVSTVEEISEVIDEHSEYEDEDELSGDTATE